MVIDAHHHFWRYTPEAYGWISGPMSRIARDFLPDDLRIEAAAAGVDRVVSVQARQSLEETRWLLELAEGDSLIAGVVGWAPLADPAFGRLLDSLDHSGKLVGLRHVVQDEPDDAFLLRDDFNRGVALLAERGLVYDLLVLERQLSAAITFVDRHPSQSFVLDHLAKPKIAAGDVEPWRGRLTELARRPNVACKLSGMVTEADWGSWSLETLRPYFDAALETFGPERLMFGSDWPVCLVACEYRRWKETVEAWAAPLTQSERASLFGGCATRVYGL